jgi:hypothetical protein
MTCIVADAELGVMAADMKVCGIHIGRVVKLFGLNGSVYATAGSAAWGEMFAEWLKGGQKKSARDALYKQMKEGDSDFQALQIRPDKKIVLWETPWIPIVLEVPVFGIGSGSPYALGAFSAGAKLEDSIRIAARWDEGTGPEVQTLSLEQIRRKRAR